MLYIIYYMTVCGKLAFDSLGALLRKAFVKSAALYHKALNNSVKYHTRIESGFYKTHKVLYGHGSLVRIKLGEIKMIKSEYGYHIIKRYELDQGAFNNSVNQAYFENFNDAVVDYLFFIKMDDYKERIVVDENALKGVDMKSVEPNYYY